jgi:hypothetical protein
MITFMRFVLLCLMAGSAYGQSSLPLTAGKVLSDRIDLASNKKIRLPEGRWVVMGLYTNNLPLAGGRTQSLEHATLMNEDENAPIQYLSMAWTLYANLIGSQQCDTNIVIKNRPIKDTLGTNESSPIKKCAASVFDPDFRNHLNSATPFGNALWLPIAKHSRVKPSSPVDVFGFVSKNNNDMIFWHAYINPKAYGLDQIADTPNSIQFNSRDTIAHNLLKYSVEWNKQYLQEVEKDFFPTFFKGAEGAVGKFNFQERLAPAEIIASGESLPILNNQASTTQTQSFSQSIQTPASNSPSAAERDRLSAEIEAERRKRQELQAELDQAKALAESRDSERQRPQSVQRTERRVALVIGNAQYKSSPLENSVNDATDIDQALKRFGFQTTFLRNASLSQMRESTRRFADQLTNADVALIYFAGHGIESKNKNFMIPVNADLKFEYELADQAYDAGAWLEMLEMIKSNNADRVNIVILDACRNNNLIGSRSLIRGLGRMDAPAGTFLSYSTAPGKVAADGGKGERNSPFTKNLLKAIQQPGQPIEEVFKEVRRNVTRETNGAQVPWESTSLTGFFSFRQTR